MTRKDVTKLANQGKYQEALKACNEFIKLNQPQFILQDKIYYAKLLLYSKDIASMIKYTAQILEEYPENPNILQLHGHGYIYSNHPEYGINYLLKAYKIDSENINICHDLSHIYELLKDYKNVSKFGSKVLEFLHTNSIKNFDYKKFKLNETTSNKKTKKIISFSLFGNDKKYTIGAIENVRAAKYIYPDWTCKFYLDTDVNKNILQELIKNGAEVKIVGARKNHYDALFWRFYAQQEKNVEYAIFRDCDSLISVKERNAVDEWIESGKDFHVMRDYGSHTDLILAGMWGAKGGILPKIENLLSAFTIKGNTRTKFLDQQFLASMVWPLIYKNTLIHDSYFDCFGAKRFPKYGTLINSHIGENKQFHLKNFNIIVD